MNTLEKKILNRLQTKQVKTRSPNKVYVLSQKNNLEDLLKKGYTLKDIYETLRDENRITCSYEAFRKLINRYIGRKRNNRTTTKEEDKNQKFEFISEPNKDDLI